MDKLLSNKWLLIGGAGVLALGAFFLMRGGSAASADSGDDGIWGTPSLMYAGGYGAGTGGGLASDASSSAADSATQMLMTLENKKADIQRELGLGSLANEKELGLAGYQTQKDIAFRGYDSADFASAAEIFGSTVGRVKSKNLPAVLRSGVGLSLNLGGKTSTISLGSAGGNPVSRTPTPPPVTPPT